MGKMKNIQTALLSEMLFFREKLGLQNFCLLYGGGSGISNSGGLSNGGSLSNGDSLSNGGGLSNSGGLSNGGGRGGGKQLLTVKT